jgi:hypothetical protein
MPRTPTQLNFRRAAVANDSRLCSPLEMLRQLIADIESGEIKPEQIIVLMMEPTTDENWHYRFRCAGASSRDLLSLVTMAQADILKRMDL